MARRLLLVGALLAAAIGVVAVALRRDPGTGAAHHLGGARCAVCHAAEAALWRGSHHDLAMQEATPTTVLGDFADRSFAHFGVTTTFRRDGERFVVRTDGPDGTPRDFDVRYAFGVTPLQQYLLELPGGRLQALGVAWDSRPSGDGGQRWFHLYPDEPVPHGDALHWTGPWQNWNHMCAACHSTGLRKRYEPGADRFATAWQELDVSCEACHGPGSRHVAWAERGADRRGDPSAGLAVRLGGRGEWQRAPEADTAVRVSVAAASPELDTCARCHARRSALVETDPDGRPFLDSYRPALLHDGLYFADGQILDEVYEWGSFVQSRMHHAGVTCSDCHEPHSLSLRHDGNALCAQCHSPARFDAPSHHFHAPGTPGSRCVDCHMPERTYMVVDVRRDHSFRVPRPDLSGPIGAPDACTSCHDGRTPEWAAAAIRAHLGEPRRREPHFGGDLHAARAGDRDAGERLRRLAADAGAPAIARATALSMLDSWPGPATTAAVGRAAMDAEPLVRLGAASTLLAIAPAEQRRFLRLCDDPLRAVRVEAARALAPLVHDPSLAVSERTSLERALDELVESQRLDGDRAAAHVVLALLAVRTGDPATAEAEYRTAIRLDPTAIEARVNLADLYRDLDRDAEGEVVLREAIALASDSAEAHHALGLLLVRQRRLADALPFLMRADELRPENPRFGYVYGVALHEAGDTSSALRVLARTHERHPAGRDVLVALTTIARDHGDLAAAHRWADALCALAPDDETARELRDSLRRR